VFGCFISIEQKTKKNPGCNVCESNSTYTTKYSRVKSVVEREHMTGCSDAIAYVCIQTFTRAL